MYIVLNYTLCKSSKKVKLLRFTGFFSVTSIICTSHHSAKIKNNFVVIYNVKFKKSIKFDFKITHKQNYMIQCFIEGHEFYWKYLFFSEAYYRDVHEITPKNYMNEYSDKLDTVYKKQKIWILAQKLFAEGGF